jgi:hypothetical protein
VGVMPDLHTMIRKSEMRLLGLLLGAGWAAGMTLVLSFSGHFPVYLAFLFLGMFLAAYWAKVDEKNAYIGVQMGLVLPLVAVVPLEELGSLSGAGFRLEGVLVAIAASLVVAAAWPTWNRPVH